MTYSSNGSSRANRSQKSTYENNIKANKISKTTNYINNLTILKSQQPSFKTGIDMIPVMTNFGDSALGGVRTKSSSSKGKIRLPIFKLPSIDLKRSTSAEMNIKDIDKKKTTILFIPFSSLSTIRRAIVKMIQQMHESKTQLNCFQRAIHISEEEISNIEKQLNKVINISSGSVPKKRTVGFTYTEVIMGLAENEITDSKETVFASARRSIFGNNDDVDIDNNHSLTSSLDKPLSRFGVSLPSIHNFPSQVGSHANLLTRQPSLHRNKSKKDSQDFEEDSRNFDSKDLTAKLVTSLKNMERHTLKVTN